MEIGLVLLAICFAVTIASLQSFLGTLKTRKTEHKRFQILKEADEALRLLRELSDKVEKLRQIGRTEDCKHTYEKLETEKIVDSFQILINSNRDLILSCLEWYEADPKKGISEIAKCVVDIKPFLMGQISDVEKAISDIKELSLLHKARKS